MKSRCIVCDPHGTLLGRPEHPPASCQRWGMCYAFQLCGLALLLFGWAVGDFWLASLGILMACTGHIIVRGY